MLRPNTRVVTFANQKGGTGKSTVTANVAAAAGERGQRVLVVDVDPQADASTMLGVDPFAEGRKTLFNVMLGECEIPEATARDVVKGVDVVVGHPDMSQVEIQLSGQMRREEFLLKALFDHVDEYDLVLIDSPPNLGLLTINALVAANDVVGVVSMVDLNAYKGVLALMNTLEELRSNRIDVRLAGIAKTQVERKRLTYQALQEEMAEEDLPMFRSEIPLAAAFHNAGASSVPLVLFAPDHVAASKVRELTTEILEAGVVAEAAA
ncbi:AAA family ATPase [Conexibacter sp. W3-3-2]|nr:AAA family ATPase [Conexibacter sp. W3-3-2]MTD47585.1 AAA family ATPase [Conexibacter sp. W3-3-2]